MAIHQRYDEIYLSPHLDDAVLSCGGRITQGTRAGRKVLVVTVTAGDPPAVDFSNLALVAHRHWALSDGAVGVRRTEDVAACAVLGARWLHGPILDCIYERNQITGRPLYKTNEEIHAPVHPFESDRIDRLQEFMATLPLADQVVVPLGIGNHIDHRLTRLVAERRWCGSLLYYEDYPYSASPSARVFYETMGKGWSVEVCSLLEEDLKVKLAAIAKYRSQITAIFGRAIAIFDSKTARSVALDIERYWRCVPSVKRQIQQDTENIRSRL